MYQITKQEAFMMRENGYEKFVLKSHSKHPKYYLVEEHENVYKYYNETDDDGNPVYDKYRDAEDSRTSPTKAGWPPPSGPDPKPSPTDRCR